MRVALGVEYIGTAYSGWQSQQHTSLPTLQKSIEKALAQVADHDIQVICAGRTDAGVHALGQVIHFDTTAQRSMRSWVLGTNTHLPNDISVRWAKEMPPEFHARFSAIARRYQYLIFNHSYRSAVFNHRATWIYQPLDYKRMQEAAQYFIGEHDFSAFRAQWCQSKTPMRRVDEIQFSRQGDLISMTIKANAFLHHMVRNIMGVLLPIGRGEKEPQWAQEVLNSRDRKTAGVTAAADGLYLAQVYYPSEFGI
jgi:tRNA pseudouridine38-40 synthase